MARRIDHRSTVPRPADEVAAAMLDPEYLRARLDRMGGPGAALLEHEAGPDGGRYRIRHGVDQAMLPSIVRNLVSGDLMIERTETLRRSREDHWAGDTDVRIPGAPVSARGTMAVTGGPASSEFLVTAEVTVAVPFIGGRIEATIAENVAQLLAAETTFTLEWLKR